MEATFHLSTALLQLVPYVQAWFPLVIGFLIGSKHNPQIIFLFISCNSWTYCMYVSLLYCMYIYLYIYYTSITCVVQISFSELPVFLLSFSGPILEPDLPFLQGNLLLPTTLPSISQSTQLRFSDERLEMLCPVC